jgi:hypothetical protein
MAQYRVEVSWTVMGEAIVEANSEEEAREKAFDVPLGDYDQEYLSDSFEVDEVIIQATDLDKQASIRYNEAVDELYPETGRIVH